MLPCDALFKASRPLDGVSVLVTDDHADSADLLDTVLAAKGAMVRVAYGALDALDALAAFVPHALVLDLSMPDIDGYELLRRIRLMPRLAHVPAIALTAHARDLDRERALAAGFTSHTAKPVDAEALVHLLGTLTKPNTVDPPARVAELAEVLQRRGLTELLRALNASTSYRFTALYRYDGPLLRNVALVDRLDPTTVKGDDAAVATTFCGVVKRERAGFATDLGAADPRVAGLPLREDLLSYCGALVRYPDGTPFGSLCHFDPELRPVSAEALALLEAFAPTLAQAVAPEPPAPLA